MNCNKPSISCLVHNWKVLGKGSYQYVLCARCGMPYYYQCDDDFFEENLKAKGAMKKRLYAQELTSCIDCPYLKFVFKPGSITHMWCEYMEFEEIICGSNAQREIDILNDWFLNDCDLEQIK